MTSLVPPLQLDWTEDADESSLVRHDAAPNFYQQLQKDIQSLRSKVDQQLHDMVTASSLEMQNLSQQLKELTTGSTPTAADNKPARLVTSVDSMSPIVLDHRDWATNPTHIQPQTPGSLRQQASPRHRALRRRNMLSTFSCSTSSQTEPMANLSSRPYRSAVHSPDSSSLLTGSSTQPLMSKSTTSSSSAVSSSETSASSASHPLTRNSHQHQQHPPVIEEGEEEETDDDNMNEYGDLSFRRSPEVVSQSRAKVEKDVINMDDRRQTHARRPSPGRIRETFEKQEMGQTQQTRTSASNRSFWGERESPAAKAALYNHQYCNSDEEDEVEYDAVTKVRGAPTFESDLIVLMSESREEGPSATPAPPQLQMQNMDGSTTSDLILLISEDDTTATWSKYASSQTNTSKSDSAGSMTTPPSTLVSSSVGTTVQDSSLDQLQVPSLSPIYQAPKSRATRKFFPDDDEDESTKATPKNESGDNTTTSNNNSSHEERTVQSSIANKSKSLSGTTKSSSETKTKSSVSWADHVTQEPADYAIRPSVSELTSPAVSSVEHVRQTVQKQNSVIDLTGIKAPRDAPSSQSRGPRPDPSVQSSSLVTSSVSSQASSWARVLEDTERQLLPVRSPGNQRAFVATEPPETYREALDKTLEQEEKKEPETSIVVRHPDIEKPRPETEKARPESKKTPLEPEPSPVARKENRVLRLEQVTDKTIQDPYGDFGTYTGILLRGKPHGQGSMKYADGRSYLGEWKSGRWDGHGRTMFANGDVYSGQYQMDKRNGIGRYEWSDGRIYDGDFVDDRREGKGTFNFPDGSSYSGGFHAGQRHGQGCYRFADSSVYTGEFLNGNYNGNGECIWTDGRCYRGEWRNGRAHGFGTEFRPDGTIRHEGEWRNDRPVKSKCKTDGDTASSLKSSSTESTQKKKETSKQRGRSSRSKSPQLIHNMQGQEKKGLAEKRNPGEEAHQQPEQTQRQTKYAVAGEPQWASRIRAKKQAAKKQSRSPIRRMLIRD